MTPFNPENKPLLTYGECLDPAMKITAQADADQYFAAYVKYQEANMHDTTKKDIAEQICRMNLGYWAGYFGDETRDRVERLFKCSHPVFGKIDELGSPTGKEALQCGMENKTLEELRNEK